MHDEETRAARDYLSDMEARYRTSDHPPVKRHEWHSRARRTLGDLDASSKATTVEYGDLYAMPYVAGQYPDSMVQLLLLSDIQLYRAATGHTHSLEARLRAGISRFFDSEVGTLRRYLPSVGNEKDYDAVDSWYLYHAMVSLARLAERGDSDALSLLLRSVDYGIRAARHFNYAWPIVYKIQDFSVITQRLDEGRPGETDAGGLYAYLMVRLYGLTGDERFLAEARAALKAADGLGLDLMYQINLTAWGAVASLRLWSLTNDERFLGRSHYWLANLFRHCQLTESRSGFAVHYPTFMSAPCMYNSDYFAPFEDMECFTALDELLAVGERALDPAAVTLSRAFRRYALHRGWYCYPDQLPAAALAETQESGHIDRYLSFPLEDVYADGRSAGQIGQEIYGAGMALRYAGDDEG